MMLTAARMRSLPAFFQSIDDPRRRQGRRHALPTILALAAAATLCGMRGYKAISEWVENLGPKELQRFRVRRRDGQYRAPSLSAKRRIETAFGVTNLTPETATPERLLTLNRGHWTIEAAHHILDWSFDEDRSRIRTGHGPENMTRLRRFAIGLIKARGLAVAETMRNLARNPRRVLDFLKMTAPG